MILSWLPSCGTLCLCVAVVLASLTLGSASNARAQGLMGQETGLPLPRYVSLKSGKVNVRVGPSRNHAVVWIYQRSGLPVEIIAEFEHWRRIRDADGEAGWVYHSLLDGDRTAILRPDGDEETVSIYQTIAMGEAVAAAQNGVIGDVEECASHACRLKIGDFEGWVRKGNLWGVYGDEVFD